MVKEFEETTGLETVLHLLSFLLEMWVKTQLNVSIFYSVSQISTYQAAVTVCYSKEVVPLLRSLNGGRDKNQQRGQCEKGEGQEWSWMRSEML